MPQGAQRSHHDVYAVSQQQRQTFDIETPAVARQGHSSQPPVQVVATRETALIYVRERPSAPRPAVPPVAVLAVPQPAAPQVNQPVPVANADEMSTEAKVLGLCLSGCLGIGLSALAFKKYYS